MSVVDIDATKCDTLVRKFMKHTGLPGDDPIVKRLRRDVKRTLGRARWRNRIEAEHEEMQPRLFPAIEKTKASGGA